MTWQQEIRAALEAQGGVADSDVIEELAQHADAAFAAARAEGRDPDAALAHARALVRSWTMDPARLSRRPRRPSAVEPPPTGRASAFTGLPQDVRYGVRVLRRQPGFAATAVALIALGVGATTTLAALVYAVLLKPLPWAHADRLVRLTETREGATREIPGILTNATYLAWIDQPKTLSAIGAWNGETVTVTGGDAPERLQIVQATASMFSVLDTRAAVGRLFTAADETPGADRVVVLSPGLWRRHFGGDVSAIGKTIEFDGEPYRVVGVAADHLDFPTRTTQAYVPLHVQPVVGDVPGSMRSVSLMRAIGRLSPDVSIAQAAAEGNARGRAAPSLGMVGTAMFGTEGAPRITVAPYLESVVGDVRTALLVMLSAVVLLLAASASNVSGMLLVRAAARRREIAIRAALGAQPGRLARQLLIEHLLIAVAGGVCGWLLALAIHAGLPAWLPADFPRADEVVADWRLLAVAIATSLAACLGFGVVPALLARRVDLVQALNEDSLAPTGAGQKSRVGRLRALTMGSQVAIAALLLVGAALVGRSFVFLMGVDRGFDPHNLLTATLPTPTRTLTGPARAALIDDIVRRVSSAPGVIAASASNVAPLLPYDQVMAFRMPSGRAGGEMVPVRAALRTIGPGYVTALGMRLIEGREFTDADTAASEPALIINRAFVTAYLPNVHAGDTLPVTFNHTGPNHERIVGIVDDVRQRSAQDPPQPEVFVNYRQLSDGLSADAPVIVARTSGDPVALVPVLRSIVHERAPSLALDSVLTMDERLSTSLARPRLYAVMLASFAAFCLLLAGAGLFSVLSYSVAQRTREIGVRSALGARPRDIVALVVRQTMMVAGAGVAVGLGAALFVGRGMTSLFYGVTWRDPVSFAAVAAVLMVVTVLACLGPARRAARVDPLKALRAR